MYTSMGSNEYVSDVLQDNYGNIYISLVGYYSDQDGVYKSEDDGNTWQRLYNEMTYSLAMNSSNDLFIASASEGLLVLRNGVQQWETLMAIVTYGILITPQDHIYFTSGPYYGVVRSMNDGLTFEVLNEGLSLSPMEDIVMDNDGHLYVSEEFSSSRFYKSENILVNNPEINNGGSSTKWMLYPNPADNYITIKGQDTRSSLVQAFNMLNQKVLEQSFNHGDRIDVSALKPGIYFLRIDDKQVQTKIIIN